MSDSPLISVLIPVRNGGDDFARCLTAIERQRVDDAVEIVVVDSGSIDQTIRVAREHGARVFEIPKDEFRHGRTRNVAAEHARGELLVFTTQDAFAERSDWLERLTAPLRAEETLAGVYGRQIAHKGSSPPEEFFLDFLYGSTPRVQRISHADDLSLRTTLFSNVSSAIPRSIWKRFPFDDDVFFAEDQEWARRVLLAGYALRYEPAAVVRHSHAYTVKTAFRRFFDLGANADRAFLAGSSSSTALREDSFRYGREELAWLIRTRRPQWIPYTACYELAKFLGLQLGARHRFFPLWAKRYFSAFPDIWDSPAAGSAQAASAQKTRKAAEPGSDSR
jgi:rhamnosyltransferase